VLLVEINLNVVCINDKLRTTKDLLYIMSGTQTLKEQVPTCHADSTAEALTTE
jgi:hypothetical protein